jgi:hypothetical protein
LERLKKPKTEWTVWKGTSRAQGSTSPHIRKSRIWDACDEELNQSPIQVIVGVAFPKLNVCVLSLLTVKSAPGL